MAVQTHLDQIINYTSTVIREIAKSKEIAALILDKKDPDIDGDDGDRVRNNIYDYDYIDETQLEAKALIMIDCDMVRASSGTIKDMEVYVQVVVSKQYMKLSGKTFPGVKGNRRDNICRQIDLLLNRSQDFGIGKLQLSRVQTANVPAAYTSKLMVYKCPDFVMNRAVGIK